MAKFTDPRFQKKRHSRFWVLLMKLKRKKINYIPTYSLYSHYKKYCERALSIECLSPALHFIHFACFNRVEQHKGRKKTIYCVTQAFMHAYTIHVYQPIDIEYTLKQTTVYLWPLSCIQWYIDIIMLYHTYSAADVEL